jgi:hypothetical protein
MQHADHATSVPAGRVKYPAQVLAVDPAGVGRGEDSAQAAVCCHESAPEVMDRHMFEDVVER